MTRIAHAPEKRTLRTPEAGRDREFVYVRLGITRSSQVTNQIGLQPLGGQALHTLAIDARHFGHRQAGMIERVQSSVTTT